MKNRHNIIANAIVRIAKMMADKANGSASAWSVYQPEEPKRPQK